MRLILCAMPGPQAEATLAALIAAAQPPAAILIPAPPGTTDWLALPAPRRSLTTLHPITADSRARPPSLRDQAAAADIAVFAVSRHARTQVAALISAAACNVVVVSCWPWRIPRDWLSLPRDGFLNIHPGPLPTLRGPAPLFWALRLGWAVSRVTLHAMDADFDSGPILSSIPLALPIGADSTQLDRNAGALGTQLVLAAAADLPAAMRTARRQPAAIAAWPAPTDADFTVPSDWSVARAARFISAVSSWGRPFVYRSVEETVQFRRIRSASPSVQPPGLRLDFSDGVLLVE